MAVRAIIPDEPQPDALRQGMLKGMEDMAEAIIEDFEKLTQFWKGPKPKWKVLFFTTRGRISFQVQLANPASEAAKIFGYLDKGTKAHIIRPKKAGGVLVFRENYTPGSFRNSLRVRRSSSSGKQVFVRGPVPHPGSDPRNWSVLIAEKWDSDAVDFMDPFVDEAVVETGHAI